MEFKEHTFDNGIRLLYKQSRGPVSHLALLIKAGSRDEFEEEQGMAHFVEHCLFKGTSKRKTYHILSRLDDVGGELNAYTSKEETTLYATVLKKDYKRAADLLCDIAFRSTFPEKEIAKEVDVIIDEINAYKDNPSDLIFDVFDELLFPSHSMGKNILGTPEHLRSFNRNMIINFTNRLYLPASTVIASSSALSFERVVKIWEPLVNQIQPKGDAPPRVGFEPYYASQKQMTTPQVQSHTILGNRAYPMSDDKAIPFLVLNNLLGGPSMSSRLNLRIRERFGLTYHLESFYHPFTDTGIWGVYMSTEPSFNERVLDLVNKELRDLRVKKLGLGQLNRAKKQLQGQIAIGQENPGSAVIGAAKAWLCTGKIEPLSLTLERITLLKAEELQEVAQEIFDPNALSLLHIKGHGESN